MKTMMFRRDRSVAGVVEFDDRDEHLVAGRSWHLSDRGYAKDANGVLMHRLIMGFVKGDGRMADHINGDRLDNRRSNLREVGYQENAENVRARPGSSSRHRGVRRLPHVKSKPWEARVKHHGRDLYRKSFGTEEEAHRAVSAARARLFAATNENRHIIETEGADA